MARSRWAAFGLLTAVVLWFSGAWAGGELVIDGPGAVLFVRLALRYVSAGAGIPYWIPDMWAGTPVWAIGPSLPIVILVPLAAVLGPIVAVKAAMLAFQVLGAWGAYVLARSLWDHRPAAAVAGVAYGLSPIVIVLTGLLGSETSMGVMAATPWIVWAFRLGLRGAGTRYLVVTGLLIAFAVLHQGEYAYGLALLGGCLFAVEVGRVRRGLSTIPVRRLVARAMLVVAVGLGLVAHWLFAFLALSKSFVLSPRELVQAELLQGLSATVGREMGIFLHRSGGLYGVVVPHREGLISNVFYLGWVAVAISFVTVLLLARRDDEGTLSAVLLASGVSVWLSTGAIALADGGPAIRGQVVSFVLVGGVAGLLLGGFVRRLGVGRKGRPGLPLIVAVGAFLFALPYITPFLVLQRVVPLLASIRFPRFYVVAALGLALGTAWPVVRLGELARSRWPDRKRVLPAALALVVTVALLIDVWPYRTLYRLRGPESEPAYVKAFAELGAAPGPVGRVIPAGLDPRQSDRLLVGGQALSIGWPHPLAARQLWRVTMETFPGPDRYAKDALGLSATTHILREFPDDFASASESVGEVRVIPNERSLPLVRAYDRVLLVDDGSVAPELAVSLAYRNVGVVTGEGGAAEELGSLTLARTGEDACRATSTDDLPPALAGEIGMACGIHAWTQDLPSGTKFFGATLSPGANFTALADGLRGLSLWLDALPGNTQLVLNELEPDGRTKGREVARGPASDLDEYSLTSYAFEPLPDSAGKRYAFTLECPGCFTETEPRMITGVDIDRGGNMTVSGEPSPRHTAVFIPTYDRLPPEPPSGTDLEVERPGPGEWRIRSSGSEPALVVVAEANFPGWTALVDGRPAPVLEADGAFLGVVVGAGQHDIFLEYKRPVAAVVGRLITGATLLAIVVGGLLARRRRRHPAVAPDAPAGDGVEEPVDLGED